MKYVIESQAGRIWGPFKSAALAARWANAQLAGSHGKVNAYKIMPLHRPR